MAAAVFWMVFTVVGGIAIPAAALALVGGAGFGIVSEFLAEAIVLVIAIPLGVGTWIARRTAARELQDLRMKDGRPLIALVRSSHSHEASVGAMRTLQRGLSNEPLVLTFEEVLADYLWRYGPVETLVGPTTSLSPPVASRAQHTIDAPGVDAWLAEASTIFIAVGRAPDWTCAAVGELQRLGLLDRSVFFLSPEGDPEELRSSWAALWAVVGDRLGLPRDIDLGSTRIVVPRPIGDAVAIVTKQPQEHGWRVAIDAAMTLRSTTAAGAGTHALIADLEAEPLTARAGDQVRWSLTIRNQGRLHLVLPRSGAGRPLSEVFALGPSEVRSLCWRESVARGTAPSLWAVDTDEGEPFIDEVQPLGTARLAPAQPNG